MGILTLAWTSLELSVILWTWFATYEIVHRWVVHTQFKSLVVSDVEALLEVSTTFADLEECEIPCPFDRLQQNVLSFHICYRLH